MDETWIPLMASILIPMFGIFITYRNARQDPGAIRKMRRHAELLNILPSGSQPMLEQLLTSEVEQYSARQSLKQKRKLDGETVGALIFIAVILGTALYFLLIWALAWPPAWFVFGFVALVGLTFMIVGSGQLYKSDAQPDTKASM